MHSTLKNTKMRNGVFNTPIHYLVKLAIFSLYLFKIISAKNSSHIKTFLNEKMNTYAKNTTIGHLFKILVVEYADLISLMTPTVTLSYCKVNYFQLLNHVFSSILLLLCNFDSKRILLYFLSYRKQLLITFKIHLWIYAGFFLYFQ